MACIGCEEYATRITNIFRDEELKNKFEELVSVEIQMDCFICDICNAKLTSAHEFRIKCFDIYKKQNNVLIYKHVEPMKNTLADRIPNEEFFLIPKELNESDLELIEQEEIDSIVEIHEDALEDSYFPSSPEDPLPLPLPQTRKRKQNLESITPNAKKLKLTVASTSTPHSTSDSGKIETTRSRNTKNETAETSFQNKRNSYTVGTKLSVLDLAEKQGNRVAARVYHINESCVRGWRKQKDQLLKMNINKKTQRRAFPHWPELEVELKQWVDEQYEKGSKVKFQEIKNKSIEIAQKQRIENFKGTNSFIFKFMKRNDVPSASPKTRRNKVETLTTD